MKRKRLIKMRKPTITRMRGFFGMSKTELAIQDLKQQETIIRLLGGVSSQSGWGCRSNSDVM